MRKWKFCAALFLVTALLFSGCTKETAVVPVVQMRLLTQAGEAGEHFAGVVVSRNAVQVRRDPEQTVEELCVAEGDVVKQGQILFRYDSDSLNLTLDKQELELERLKADIKETKSQISQVEKELKNTKDESLKTQLNIQLRQLQNNLKEAEYAQEDLNTAIKRTEALLKNVDVKSPSGGTVRTIDENGEVYIVIQQTGAYQVQGTLNEMSLNAGITVGAEVVVVSRLDETRTWTGTVTDVDYNNASSNSYDSMFGNADSMSSSTSYPFTVALDSTEGLLLGQHVYIRLAGLNEGGSGRMLLPESYVMDYAYDNVTMITSGTVWCPDAEGKLMKQSVVLGEYVDELGCYVVLEGLSMDHYVADPTNPDCAEGVLTDLRRAEDFSGGTREEEPRPTEETQPQPSTETEE